MPSRPMTDARSSQVRRFFARDEILIAEWHKRWTTNWSSASSSSTGTTTTRTSATSHASSRPTSALCTSTGVTCTASTPTWRTTTSHIPRTSARLPRRHCGCTTYPSTWNSAAPTSAFADWATPLTSVRSGPPISTPWSPSLASFARLPTYGLKFERRRLSARDAARSPESRREKVNCRIHTNAPGASDRDRSG